MDVKPMVGLAAGPGGPGVGVSAHWCAGRVLALISRREECDVALAALCPNVGTSSPRTAAGSVPVPRVSCPHLRPLQEVS